MEQKLYRDKTRAIAGGVAAGISNYLHLDTTLVRAVFVFLILFGRTGRFGAVVVYCILWIALPPLTEELRRNSSFETDYRIDPDTGAPYRPAPATHKTSESSRIFGFILLGLGLVFLADRFIDIDWDFDRYWPVLLIAAGILLLVSNRNKLLPGTSTNSAPMGGGYTPPAGAYNPAARTNPSGGSANPSSGTAGTNQGTGTESGTGYSAHGGTSASATPHPGPGDASRTNGSEGLDQAGS